MPFPLEKLKVSHFYDGWSILLVGLHYMVEKSYISYCPNLSPEPNLVLINFRALARSVAIWEPRARRRRRRL